MAALISAIREAMLPASFRTGTTTLYASETVEFLAINELSYPPGEPMAAGITPGPINEKAFPVFSLF